MSVLHTPIIYHRVKNQKKLMSYSLEKCRTDGETDGQRDNGCFIGPTVGRGSKKLLLKTQLMSKKHLITLFFSFCANTQ